MLLPLLCSMPLNYPKFDDKSNIFPNFGQGPFPKIAGKSPDLYVAQLMRFLVLMAYDQTSGLKLIVCNRKIIF